MVSTLVASIQKMRQNLCKSIDDYLDMKMRMVCGCLQFRVLPHKL
jgi:hypothetical protein